jgi:predicted nucleic acid-binding Zn ribbon protein
MAKGKTDKKMSKEQRRSRSTQIIFIIISIIVIITWLLSFVAK